jgi:hypothetical protein
LECIALLLLSDCDVLARAFDGTTAAHVAVQLGREDAVLAMLRWMSGGDQEKRFMKFGIDSRAKSIPITKSASAAADIEPLSSATYASFQSSSSSSSISALLGNMREFPDMLNEDEKKMRIERCCCF